MTNLFFNSLNVLCLINLSSVWIYQNPNRRHLENDPK